MSSFTKYLIYSISLLFFCSLSFSNYYVSPEGDDNAVGDFDNPLRTITRSAELVAPGDTVFVSAGIYYESIEIKTSADSAHPIVFMSVPGEDVTIKAQTDFCFMIEDSVEYIVIDGFNITQGYARLGNHGAGIRIFGNYCTVKNCHVYDNDAGLFVETFTLDTSYTNYHNTLYGNIISENYEAGIRIKRSDYTKVISNVFFLNGVVDGNSGALTFYGADSTTVLNNTFWDNHGPAIHIYDGTDEEGTPVTTRTLLANNIAVSPTAKILFRVDSRMEMEVTNKYSHNLWYNSSPGSLLVLWGPQNTGLGGTEFAFDQFILRISELDSLNGIGFLETDPLFVDASDFDFDLQMLSPAIDAGFMSIDQIGIEGLTCLEDQSLDAGSPDLGFHHLPNAYLPNPLVVRRPDINVFPNPSNAIIQFDIQLPFSNTMELPSLSIYNVNGQKVDNVFLNQDNKLNNFRLSWRPGENISSGIYFAVIKSAGSIHHKKLVIIR